MTKGIIFGIDVGGSGIKGAPVDAVKGDLTAARYRIPTPQPSTPDKVAATVAAIVEHWEWKDAIGVAIPSVVQNGIVSTAANIDDAWIGTNAEALFESAVGNRVRVLNDADAAGIAEMKYGIGDGEKGLVVLLTFGTGIGSAMFYGGDLIPNSEFGHLEYAGMTAEHYAAARLVEHEGMTLADWVGRVAGYLRYLERALTPDLFIFGGGISRRFDEFAGALELHTPVKAAELRNNAGIVGAALAGRVLTKKKKSKKK